jgi:hypothetical protein
MKKAFTRLIAGMLAATGLQADDSADRIEQARQATAQLGSALKSELIAAMQSGGALQAIEVCHTRAGEIAGDVSRKTGLEVSRISAGNRNPGNAANDWQLEVLSSFDRRLESGESPAGMNWYETAETESGMEFRYMQAIPTGGLCLQCHGTAIAPDVADRLHELYPADRATGYREGDIRGAFLVVGKPD